MYSDDSDISKQLYTGRTGFIVHAPYAVDLLPHSAIAACMHTLSNLPA